VAPGELRPIASTDTGVTVSFPSAGNGVLQDRRSHRGRQRAGRAQPIRWL